MSTGTPVVPTVNAVTQSTVALNSGASNTLVSVRSSFDIKDDVISAGRLSNDFPSPNDVPCNIDSITTIDLTAAVSTFSLVGIKNGAATGNCIDVNDTTTEALDEQTVFDFTPPVDCIVVTVSGSPDGRNATATIQGYVT